MDIRETIESLLNTRENIAVNTYTGNVNVPGEMRIKDGKNVNYVLMFLLLHINVKLKISDTIVIFVLNREVIVFPKKSLLWSAPAL